MPSAPMQPAPQPTCHHKPAFQSQQREAWKAGRDSGEPRSDGLFTITGTEDFPGWPVVGTLPCNVGEAGSTPRWRTKIPYALEQLSPHATVKTQCSKKKRKERHQIDGITPKQKLWKELITMITPLDLNPSDKGLRL